MGGKAGTENRIVDPLFNFWHENSLQTPRLVRSFSHESEVARSEETRIPRLKREAGKGFCKDLSSQKSMCGRGRGA